MIRATKCHTRYRVVCPFKKCVAMIQCVIVSGLLEFWVVCVLIELC